VTEPLRLELEQPRDITAIFRDALRVFLRHFWTFLALSAVVVVPVQMLVSGFGLGEFTRGYDSSPRLEETLIPAGVSFLVVAPLISAICIHALQSVAKGEAPRARHAIVEGFEAFTPIFLAILLVAAGVGLGLLLLVVPGIYVAVRWYFVPQAVVVENARGPAALARSMQLTDGAWWRTFGIVLLANLAGAVPGLVLAGPLAAVAEATDRAVWSLVGATLTQVVSAPFLALIATLLYYDLRARSGS
jgi:hypothetical protein